MSRDLSKWVPISQNGLQLVRIDPIKYIYAYWYKKFKIGPVWFELIQIVYNLFNWVQFGLNLLK